MLRLGIYQWNWCLFDDLGNSAGADGAAAFTDGELGALLHSDRVDQFNGEGDVIARHDHLGSSGKGDGAGDIGGAEEELRTIAVEEVGVTAKIGRAGHRRALSRVPSAMQWVLVSYLSYKVVCICHS